ncbi:hypothetical protein [Streptomyces sp. TS71-3]|uniref:hypothetical protein n=1 Tax=Streptomyces sp. TS71-3 TaxID=2733862 RepID=UPI001B1F1FF8|nr:hypothetical protein [Streptomyces sp. TS71-3]GHJ35447.1 hypothetical protein Sm713_10560 [Streptomyces sp. TS71-3]
MDINVILRILQEATADIESVKRNRRARWSAEYVQVLKAFAALDAWISQGKPLPELWAVHHRPPQPRREQRPQLLPKVPRPRQKPQE